MTTTQERTAPRPAGEDAPAAPLHRGPLVAAGVVLLLWVVWLLVPEAAKVDLLGAPDPGAGVDAPAGAPGEGTVAEGAEAEGAEGAGGAADPVAAASAAAVPTAAPAAPGAAATAAPTPTAAAAGAPAAAPAVPVEVPRAGDGSFAVAPGTGEQVGDGRLVRYTVEVEGGLPLDPAEVAGVVEEVLADPRSWTGDGAWALQRVDADPDARIVVASPDTTDRMCAPLRTRGEVSCRNGDDVVLNARRWTRGATTWGDDVDGYRRYVVNHELGHYLGNGHVPCPADGEPAPVMLQQTVGLQGCLPNAWPHP
ncbi:DUF3152 domain-containing protein [Aquipuribacter hungaricus]|uniref:DUF3152 domain-containing protein n=2 Tax=Aquipuribacter hungaricus TaxID=545624 RepID=UPI00360FCBDC